MPDTTKRKPISKASRRTILKRMLRVAAQNKRDDLANGYTPFIDTYVFCNSFSAYALNDHMDYAPMRNPLRRETIEWFSESKAAANCHTIPVNRNTLRTILEKAKTMPGRTADEKRAKVNASLITLTDGDFKITFNAMYLLDLVNMFDADEIWCDDSPYHPCFVYGRDGEWGMLCPIRVA